MVKNYVFTVAGSKGGVGKTTTSINLGACLAKAGYATAVVEVDLPMANLVDFVDLDIDVSEATTLHDVLAGEASVGEAVYDVDDRLAVVPSGTDLDGYAAADIDRLEPALERLRWHFDVMILDTPAGLSDAVIKPIEVADETVLISTPRVSSVRNVRNTKEVAQRADTEVRGLVLSKSGTGASPGADRIAEFLDMDLLGHVPEDDAVPHSQDQGEPVVENAPNSGAAIAYRKIAAELVDTDALSATEPVVDESGVAGSEVTAGSGSDGERVATSDGGRARAAPDPEPTTDPPPGPDEPEPGTAGPGPAASTGDGADGDDSTEPTPAVVRADAAEEAEPAVEPEHAPVGDPDPAATDVDGVGTQPDPTASASEAGAGATAAAGTASGADAAEADEDEDGQTPAADGGDGTEDGAEEDTSLGARIRSAIGL